jgi:hypothetical protein
LREFLVFVFLEVHVNGEIYYDVALVFVKDWRKNRALDIESLQSGL